MAKTGTKARRTAAAAMLLLGLVLLAAARAEDECCSTCIGKVASSVYDYDPLVFAQCSVKNVSRVCCFNCGSMGDPSYGETVSFASDGTTPVVKTGTWVKLKWTDVQNVTYITLKDGQKKTTTPTINDATASVASGYFMICAQSVGKIVFRGWGDQPCREASLEKSVSVAQGTAGATCEAPEPTKPDSASSSLSGSGNASTDTCNLQRATLKVVDGKKECVCVSDWAGPPACDKMPTWKWVVTIGGGVAALLSILISVRAFLKSREKKRLLEEEATTPRLGSRKDDIEILQITPDRRGQEMAHASAPFNEPYAVEPSYSAGAAAAAAPGAMYGRENNRAASNARKADEREFTL